MVPVNFTQHHNALNLAAAVAACDGLGPARRTTLAGDRLEVELLALARRAAWSSTAAASMIADCYNANPTSMGPRCGTWLQRRTAAAPSR